MRLNRLQRGWFGNRAVSETLNETGSSIPTAGSTATGLCENESLITVLKALYNRPFWRGKWKFKQDFIFSYYVGKILLTDSSSS